MKRDILLYSTLASLLGLAACTQDEPGMLPDGTQPLTLTASIDGAAATRSTVNNTWDGGEVVAVQVDGGDWYDYTADTNGYLTGNYYWKSTDRSITVQGIYPATAAEGMAAEGMAWSVKEDQSSDEGYQAGDLLASNIQTVDYGETAVLDFYHQTAKVIVNVRWEGLPATIGATAEDISLVIGGDEGIVTDGTFTLPTEVDGDGRWLGTWTPGSNKGCITPHLSETTLYDCVATYEALVIPQTISRGMPRLMTFTATKDGISYGPFYYDGTGTEWRAGYTYIYYVYIFFHGLDVSVEESIGWDDGTGGEGSVEL